MEKIFSQQSFPVEIKIVFIEPGMNATGFQVQINPTKGFFKSRGKECKDQADRKDSRPLLLLLQGFLHPNERDDAGGKWKHSYEANGPGNVQRVHKQAGE